MIDKNSNQSFHFNNLLFLLSFHIFSSLIYRTLLLLCIHPFYDTVRQSNLDSIIELLRTSNEEHRYQLTIGFLKHLHILLINYPNILQSTSSSSLLVLGSRLVAEHLCLQICDFVGINVWDNVVYPNSELQTTKQPTGRNKCTGSFLCKLINVLVLPSSSTVSKCYRISEQNTDASSPFCMRYLFDVYILSVFCTSHPCIRKYIFSWNYLLLLLILCILFHQNGEYGTFQLVYLDTSKPL